MFLSLPLLFLATLAPVWAAPHILTPIKRHEKTAGTGKYLVTFREDPNQIFGAVSAKSKSWGIRLADNSTYTGWNFVNGFSAALTEDELRELQASPDVAEIEEDGLMRTTQLQTERETAENSFWNLARLSSSGRLNLDGVRSATDRAFPFSFPVSAGEGVNIYILDTGIRTDHREFGGRARQIDVNNLGARDVVGHGSHCAGTAAGATAGVAKKANIIGVKVLGDNGNGANSAVITGIQRATQDALQSRRPSIISMSLGGGRSNAVDNAVNAAVAAGVHVVVAAGNDRTDASTSSPARAAGALTVGATDINDNMANFSNFGSVVDVFAPGVAIVSVDAKTTNGFTVLQGTSMACPAVAGLMATILSTEGDMTPAELKARVVELSEKNAIRRLVGADTANRIAKF